MEKECKVTRTQKRVIIITLKCCKYTMAPGVDDRVGMRETDP